MLRLLLDEHLSDDIAVGVRVEATGVEIVSLREWQEGVYVGAPDDVLLRAAYAQGTTLVTFLNLWRGNVDSFRISIFTGRFRV